MITRNVRLKVEERKSPRNLLQSFFHLHDSGQDNGCYKVLFEIV